MSSNQTAERSNRHILTGAMLGLAVGYLAVPEQAFAFESAKFAIEEICAHMQGNLGALLMTTAGVGALIAAAFGNFRQSHSLIVTAIGAATISSFLSLYFADAADICEGAGDSQIKSNADEDGGNQARAFLPEFIGGVDTNGRSAKLGGIGAAELAIASGGQADFSSAARFSHGDIDHEEVRDFDPDADDHFDDF